MRPSFIRLPVAVAFLFPLIPTAQAQTGSAAPAEVVSVSAGNLSIERLATLESPWGMALLPDGRLLLTEKPGRLRIWENGTFSDPIDGLPEVVHRGTPSEQGVCSTSRSIPSSNAIVLSNLSYVEAAEPQPESIADTGDARFADYVDLSDDILRGGAVARGRLEGDRLLELEVIWRQEPKTVGRGHFGHRLIFAPLYPTAASAGRVRQHPAGIARPRAIGRRAPRRATRGGAPGAHRREA